MRNSQNSKGCEMSDKKDEKTLVLEEKTKSGDIMLRKGTKEEEKSKGVKVVDTTKKVTVSAKGKSTTKPKDISRQVVNPNKKDLYVNPQAWIDLMLLVKGCSIEISGLGLVEERDWGLEISKVFLLRQDGGAAHTTLDPMAMAELQGELADRDIDTGKLRFWWHSHMGGTNPSTTDLETFAQFGRTGAHGPDWFVFAILNSKGEGYWRMDYYRPLRFAVPLEPTIIHPGFGSQDWASEIKDKVNPSAHEWGGMKVSRNSFPSYAHMATGRSGGVLVDDDPFEGLRI